MIIKFRYYLVSFSLLIVSFSISLYAQDLQEANLSMSECINKFKIDNIAVQNYRDYANLVLDYFQCIAALQNNVKVCDKLDPANKEICYGHFNDVQGFYGRLLLNPYTTNEVLNACRIAKGDRRTCKQFADAFIKGDTAICKDSPSPKDCRALITLDPSISPSPATKDVIYYIKAMKDFQLKQCQSIKDEALNRECRAYITQDKKNCEKCQGIVRFREMYCKDIVDVKRRK